MGKTLVIAEKPSVGRDLAAALPGDFKQSTDKSHLDGDQFVISWAVGHLVGLAAPDEYDPKLKRWRFADLPILPDEFKLVPVDERSKKQLQAVHKLMRDDDVELIVNACDAGREGELIFAYLYETAGVDKPVERLWLSSMTRRASQGAFEADENRAYSGRYLGGKRIAEDLAARIVEEVRGGSGEITKLEKKEERERPQLLYDLTSLQRHANTRFGFSARRTLAAAQRLYEEHKAITYPRTSSRFLPSDQIPEIKPTAQLVGRNAEYAKAAQYMLSLDR